MWVATLEEGDELGCPPGGGESITSRKESS